MKENANNEHSASRNSSAAGVEWLQLPMEIKMLVWQRISSVSPRDIRRSWWRRLFHVPRVWLHQYAISRVYMGVSDAVRWATRWTWLLMFPEREEVRAMDSEKHVGDDSDSTPCSMEYIRLELCGLTPEQGRTAQTAIIGLILDMGLNEHSTFIREREDEDGWFQPVYSTTEGVEDE